MNTQAIAIKPATIGSVSHGTLRNVDLLDTLSKELESRVLLNGAFYALPENMAERDRLNTLQFDALELASHLEDGTKEDGEEASELVNALVETLGMLFAPGYCYFGTHPGDGSDYGYWPDMDSINELPKYNDLSEVPEDQDEDFQIVNDHGNITVYSGTTRQEIIGIV